MELKFRVWDRANKRMHSVITWHDPRYLDSVEYATGQSSVDVHELRQDENCVIMQFVGLQDSSGKDIYEWDIVECEEGAGSGKTQFAVVRWNRIVCGFNLYRRVNAKTWVLCGNVDQTINIIGNMYESLTSQSSESRKDNVDATPRG